MARGTQLIIKIIGDSKSYRKELDRIEKETKKSTKIITKSGKALTKSFNKQQKVLSKTALEAKKARKEFKKLADAEKKAAAATKKANVIREKRITLLKRTAAVLAVLAVAGISKSVVAFATFEQGLAGVSKTTNIVGRELKNLGEDITKLSISLGTSSTELLVMAKNAGQLGFEGRKNIIKFTKVIAGLGKTTNIVGEEGAIALARLIKVSNESEENVDRLGSAIVGLGNSTAALEDQILFTATEIAGAGKTFGITAEQALGLAAAFSELAVRPELARSTILRAFGEIQKAIKDGGSELEKLIVITGLTSDEIEKTFSENATKFFGIFLEGVGKLPKSEIIPFLKDFNLGGLRLEATLPKLAVGAGLVNEKLKDSSELYKENAALTKELAIQLDTTASRAKQAKEEYAAIAREIGEEFIPATESALEALRDLSPFIKENLVPALSFLVGFLAESVKGFKLFTDAVSDIISKIAEIEGIRTGFETGPVGTFVSLAKANDAVEKREEELEEILEKGFQARKERHERESEELKEFLEAQSAAMNEGREAEKEAKETAAEEELELLDQQRGARLVLDLKEIDDKKKRDKKAADDELKAKKKAAADLVKLEQAKAEKIVEIAQFEALQKIISLRQFVAEGTAASKALFLIQKAAAIAETIVSTQAAMALAIRTLPPPVGESVAIARGILGAANVAIIAGTAIKGLSSAQDGGVVPGGFGGGDRVPVLLEPGEIITPERLNPLSPNFEETFGGGGGQEITVNIELSEEASQFITVGQREDTTLGVQR